MSVKEHCGLISASDVKAEIAKGPGNFSEVVHDFCNDVRTLTERMQDLFLANKILLGLAKIKVTVKVEACGAELADYSFGVAEFKRVKNNEQTGA